MYHEPKLHKSNKIIMEGSLRKHLVRERKRKRHSCVNEYVIPSSTTTPRKPVLGLSLSWKDGSLHRLYHSGITLDMLYNSPYQ